MNETVDLPTRSGTLVSAGGYASYLWRGHCFFNPCDFKRDISSFHQDRKSVNLDYAEFKEKRAQGIAAVLLPHLGCVVKNARYELGLRSHITSDNKRLLQVYLVGEVSIAGRELAVTNGLFDDYPELESVTSPFRDSRLIDEALRVPRVGQIKESALQYATAERLLPGYPLNND